MEKKNAHTEKPLYLTVDEVVYTYIYWRKKNERGSEGDGKIITQTQEAWRER